MLRQQIFTQFEFAPDKIGDRNIGYSRVGIDEQSFATRNFEIGVYITKDNNKKL